MTHSLAYRKNLEAILNGKPPVKYTRIVPFVPGDHVVEIGSAEGVLALLLAKEGKSVTAVEKNRERHDAAVDLRARWGGQRLSLTLVCGDILELPHLLDDATTLVAIRMLYHLGERAHDVIAEAAKAGVKNIVLGGNKNRERRFLSGLRSGLGEGERFATRQGMTELLAAHGYSLVHQASGDFDPIVVGERCSLSRLNGSRTSASTVPD